MRPLSAVPDIDAPDSAYPAGRMRDDNPPTDGTPVTELLYGDIIQVIHKLMRLAGITYNDLPENETNGFQIIEALVAYVRSIAASSTQKGCVELATNAETQAGVDSQRAVTPASLESKTATISRKGVIELATSLEVQAGTDNERAITPSGLESKVATTLARGIVELATVSETQTGTDVSKVVTPYSLAGKDAGLITTMIEIGNWNMDTTATVFVDHSLTLSKIVSVEAVIRDDSDSYHTGFLCSNASGLGCGYVRARSSDIELTRTSGGLFDNVNYTNSSSYNRGWIIIRSIP